MKVKPKITVIGCGYTGLTTAVVLASSGFQVHALEYNPERLQQVRSGKPFFYEEGLETLLAKVLKEKTLVISDKYEQAIPKSKIVFSCVGTPDNPDGSSNLDFVFEAASQAVKLMEPGSIFVQKSTVPVGTGQKIINEFDMTAKSVPYVSNPEFLREGSSISDNIWPDRVIVGGGDIKAVREITEIYKDIEAGRQRLSRLANIKVPNEPVEVQYFQTSLNSAELIKVTSNAFLALKISFANSIAKLADRSDSDINEVMDAVGADRRIGRQFLYAGRGYGGGCFPKDVSGLIRSAEDYGVNLELMQVAAEVNNSMPHYIINKVRELGGNSFHGKYIAILGLAFKAGTSDTRRSPAITIANLLAQQGAVVTAYDPKAMEEARSKLDKTIKLATEPQAAINQVDYIFVATDWPEFRKLDFSNTRAKIVVDCMNCLDKSKLPEHIQYIGVGLN